MKHLSLCLAGMATILSTSAHAQRNPSAEARGTVRPSPDTYSPEYMRKSDGSFAAWASDEDERYVSHSYGLALRFAECVARFNQGTASLVLAESIAERADGIKLRRMAQVNPGCAVEHRKVHPLLLRAALAETLVEGKSGKLDSNDQKRKVGVPDVVDGYPVSMISRCQVSVAPSLVADLLATEPGGQAERDAAARLFADTPACGITKLGRLTPTAARLAVVDAAYRASIAVGARP